jgi:hypothetical protein
MSTSPEVEDVLLECRRTARRGLPKLKSGRNKPQARERTNMIKDWNVREASQGRMEQMIADADP